MIRYYIGLATTFHDPAVAIVDPDGQILHAEAAERPLQAKHAIGAPPDHPLYIGDLIARHCDPTAEICLALPWRRRHALRLGLLALYGSFSLERSIRKPLTQEYALRQEFVSFGARQLGADLAAGHALVQAVRTRFGHRRIQVRRYPHHLAHAALAAFTAPSPEGLCVIADGYGEGGATAAYRYSQGRLDPLLPPTGRDSLGFYYGVLTRLCGFDPLHGEEWKVMGLAAHGRLDEECHLLCKDLIQVEAGEIRLAPLDRLGQAIERIQGLYPPGAEPLAYADLAYTGQRCFEETLTAYLAFCRDRARAHVLFFGGGCALNSVFNGKITAELGFDVVHIPPAPADDGNALGAALLAFRADRPNAPLPLVPLCPFLGSEVSPAAAERLARYGGFARITRTAEGAVERAATLLAEGAVLGVVQGRAEFGPRALGNRSIVADPRTSAMRDHVNREVKRREDFRPLAPALLAEAMPEFFHQPVAVPYMERALRVRHGAAARIPAVVHVDGTARPQTVRADWSPHFHGLIDAFARRTGVPVLLNTSFNVMGKPMVHSVEDAAAVFATSGLDALWIGDFLVEKWSAGARNLLR